MADTKSAVSVVKKLREEQQAKEAAEEKANATPPPAGFARVRLIRGYYSAERGYLPPGVHELPEREVPVSAKRL